MTTDIAALSWRQNESFSHLDDNEGALPERFQAIWNEIVGHFGAQIRSADTLSMQGSKSRTNLRSSLEQVMGVEMLRQLPDGYRLMFPFRLILHASPGGFWVTSDTDFLYGIGDSPEEAIEDYGYALVDYYSTLQEHEDELAPHLQVQLEQLNQLIETE